MRCAALIAAAAAPAGAVRRHATTLSVPTTAPSGCVWQWYPLVSCQDGGHGSDRISDIGAGKTEAECTAACEAISPHCVAVDWAKNGDRRCRLYSACHAVPHPNVQSNQAHFWAGHYNCGGMSWGGAAHVSGDPFTSYNGGRKTQFYFPVQVPTKLLKCGDFEFDGRVMSSGVEGDTQQWFDQFRARFGETAITVGLHDAAQLLPAGVATKGSGVDVSALSAQQRVAAALAANKQETGWKQPRKLTTAAVTVQEEEVTTTGTRVVALAGGAVNITVEQDLSQRIGTGYVESVNVASKDIGIRMTSAVAEKFTGKERITKMHLDLAFSGVNASMCTGPLPEIWGVKPMSRATAKYLVPPEDTVRKAD